MKMNEGNWKFAAYVALAVGIVLGASGFVLTVATAPLHGVPEWGVEYPYRAYGIALLIVSAVLIALGICFVLHTMMEYRQPLA
jgi:hypothetical protein